MSLQLQHPDLDDFEPVVRRFIHVAHETGGDYLRSEGLGIEDLPRHPKARRVFLQKCHYGFDLAQRQIGRLVVEYERRIRALEAKLKDLRRERDPQARTVKGLVGVLESRQLVLRRILDSMLYTILGSDTSVQRRLTSNEEIRGIDPDVVAHTLEIAAERNKADRSRFNIVADLTTVVHYGDLLEVDKSARKDRQWRLIELKEGKVNELIAAELLAKGSAPTESAIEAMQAAHGPAVAKQARRVVRQQQRLAQLDEIIDTDVGVEPSTGELIARFPEVIRLTGFIPAIRAAYGQSLICGVGAAEISPCITLVAIRETAPEHVLRGAAAHACYHSRYPEAPCLLNDADRVKEELQAMREQSSLPLLI
jgi:hypothetical protein